MISTVTPTAPHRCRKPSVHPSKSPAARQSARKSPRVRTLTCRKCAEFPWIAVASSSKRNNPV